MSDWHHSIWSLLIIEKIRYPPSSTLFKVFMYNGYHGSLINTWCHEWSWILDLSAPIYEIELARVFPKNGKTWSEIRVMVPDKACLV